MLCIDLDCPKVNFVTLLIVPFYRDLQPSRFGSGFEASSADKSNPFVAAVFVDRSH